MLPAGRSRLGTTWSTSARTSRRCATCTRRNPTSRSWCARTTPRSSSGSTSARCSSRSATSSSRTREIQDVEPIVRRAHEVGAHVILDCYQSAGIVPVDVTALGVDFAVGGSVKWLCGGRANGWLYVRPDLAERLEPTLHRLAGPRAPVRVRGGARVRATAPPASSPARRTRRRTGRHGRLRPDRGDRRRAHPRELAAPDRAPHRARGRRAASRCTRPRDPARRGGAVIVGVPEAPPCTRELEARGDPLRLPTRRGHPRRAALLHDRRRDRLRRRADRRHPRDRRVREPRGSRRSTLRWTGTASPVIRSRSMSVPTRKPISQWTS